MTLVAVLPWIAGLGLVATLVAVTRRDGPVPGDAWRVPAGACAAFLAWSLAAVAVEGPLGFWAEHTRSLWGNQIWFDLLLAAGTAWCLLLPRARAVGMTPWPWLVLVLCTGSIGLMAALARLLWLEARRPAA
jgi:hypothetical protein